MARPVVLGAIVGVLAVLLLSLSGPMVLTNSATSHSLGAQPSVSPAVAPSPNPFFTDMAASVALGGPNLTSTWASASPNASSFALDPEYSCPAPGGSMWVPDFGGNRLLEFKPPFASGESASVVLGQSTFAGTQGNTTATGLYGPGACTTDAHGDLWVTDWYNSRVLEYVPPFTTGMAASLVLGQATFVAGAPGTSATTLADPVGLAFDPQGDLWVADSSNNRVVEYVPPFSDGMHASLVLGQTNFTSRAAGLTAANLSYPIDLVVSDGVLWVADYSNDRVVGFSAPFSTGEGATYLLGQSSFAGSGATGPGAFVDADSVAVDVRGDLWVADSGGNRVVEFLPPFSLFENASLAIGQTSLTATTFGLTATTLHYPLGAFVAPNGALWVTDGQNGRVLEYVPSIYHVTFAAAGLPATTNLTVLVGGTASSGPGPNLTVSEVNGSYAWSVPVIPGYALSPTSGNVTVNGHSVTVVLTVTRVTYTVTFSALGLPAMTNWTVTLGGVTHNSSTNASISFTEANGTYLFSAATVAGYNVTPTHGSVVVRGASQDVAVGFSLIPSSAGGGSSSPFSTTVTVLLIVVAAVAGLVVGLLVGLLLGRRRKGGAAAPAAPWAPPMGSPGSPPAGGPTQLPPPPPPGPDAPPPGATG